MTAEQVIEEFVAYSEANDRGQGSPYIPWDWWVANVLLPRETLKAYHADRDCGGINIPVAAYDSTDIESAVNILNHVRHADCDGWHRRGDTVEPGWGYDPHLHLSEFEAIAIAEKYVRLSSDSRVLK